MSKREERVRAFAEHLWEALPDPDAAPKVKASIFKRMQRKHHWRPSECDNYYADAKLSLAVDGRYIYWDQIRRGLRKARNAAEGHILWKHCRRVTKHLTTHANEYGSCLADDGVDGVTEISLTEQRLLPAGQKEKGCSVKPDIAERPDVQAVIAQKEKVEVGE